MCGRYILVSDLNRIAEAFHLSTSPPNVYLPHGDVHPGQKTACIIAVEKHTTLATMRWGFSSSWSKHPPRQLLINARAETLMEKFTFKEPFRHGRCLIPADGFYEWSAEKKQFYFSSRNRSLLALAGLYRQETGNARETSFVIITTAPNKLVEPIHNRMPVVIPPENRSLWLDTSFDEKAALASLLVPYPEDEMEVHVGPYRSQKA